MREGSKTRVFLRSLDDQLLSIFQTTCSLSYLQDREQLSSLEDRGALRIGKWPFTVQKANNLFHRYTKTKANCKPFSSFSAPYINRRLGQTESPYIIRRRRARIEGDTRQITGIGFWVRTITGIGDARESRP